MTEAGCNYQGYEFGAVYKDSMCVHGWLFDADNCDDSHNLYEPLDHIPCPECNPKGTRPFPVVKDGQWATPYPNATSPAVGAVGHGEERWEI